MSVSNRPTTVMERYIEKSQADLFPAVIEVIETVDELLKSILANHRAIAAFCLECDWTQATVLYSNLLQDSVNVRDLLETALLDVIRIFSHPLVLELVRSRLEQLDIADRHTRVVTMIFQNAARLPPKRSFINNLPSELLSLIFEEVVIWEFRRFSIDEYEYDDESDVLRLPQYPLSLTKVCGHWRRIINGSPALWSYIQVVASGSHRDKFYEFGSCFIERAFEVPISVRIHQPTDAGYQMVRRLAGWLMPIAGRICGLDISGGYPSCELVQSVLRTWLEYGTPGTLRELCIWYPDASRKKFIKSSSDYNPQAWSVDVPSSQMNAFFSPITVLRLHGLFACWESQAYRGVNHLELRSGTIPEQQLLEILSNLPQLYHFSFNLRIRHRKSRKASPEPIDLVNLQTLNLLAMRSSYTWSILRLLAPGAKNLTLALETRILNDWEGVTETPEAQEFFRRSTITECHLRGKYQAEKQWFPNALAALTSLEYLCLAEISYLCLYRLSSPTVCPKLRVLCMIDCKLDLMEFQKLLGAHSIKVLRLWNCEVFSLGSKLGRTPEDLAQDLSAFVEDVKCYEGDYPRDKYISKWRDVEC